ncbi:hypothetical protein [Priestia megaterium]|uniref:hypothetical protein n=1 Tax=Priestia megaterium TaxID=1404 RepID=UPI000BEDA205|nr:hypothetical protein [Priestia megaterium]PED63953.1 hypothetical protein CON20_23585 [Priestia megaterium]
MLKMIEEMVIEAAKEIEFELTDRNVEEVFEMLDLNYNIEINEDAPVTWQLMNVVVETISSWQKHKQENM